jgi:hypothetical protein
MTYSIEKRCGNGCAFKEETSLRGLGLIESTFLGLEHGDKYVEKNVPDLINNMWHRRAQVCTPCSPREKNVMLSVIRKFMNVPWIVVISLGYSNCSIDDRIRIGEDSYRLFSVSLRSGDEDNGHFIALIKLNNFIYLYDGVSNSGKFEVTMLTKFPRSYRHKDVRYSVLVLWYKLKDIRT